MCILFLASEKKMTEFEVKEVSGTYLGSAGSENTFMKNIITFLSS